VDNPVVDALAAANTTARFASYMVLFAVAIVVVLAGGVFLRYHAELSRRLMFFVSGDSKVRMNVPDALGAWVLPGKVVRIERLIVHDIDAGMFGIDLYVEVDWGINMLQSTRVRQVQPVGRMLRVDQTVAAAVMPCPRGHKLRPSGGHECHQCPRSGLTNTKAQSCLGCSLCDYHVCHEHAKAPKPLDNNTVFTDKLEFNLRPYGQGNMFIRVKDQDIIGNELVGSLELTNDQVLELAHRSIGRPLDLSTVGVFPLSVDGLSATGRQGNPSKLLIWLTVVDEFGERVMEH